MGRLVHQIVGKSAAPRLCRGMTYQPAALSDDLSSLPKLPAWVTSQRAETPGDLNWLTQHTRRTSLLASYIARSCEAVR